MLSLNNIGESSPEAAAQPSRDRSPYTAIVLPVVALDATIKRRMAEIYFSVYDGSNEDLFFGDLSNKDEALLVHCEGELIGFTTLRTFQRKWNSQQVSVVFSGDTVVERRHWGQQALAFSWIGRMGKYKNEHPNLQLYWLLLVKGHRTFRYLPLFAKSFYPHWSIDRSDLKPLADALALEMFPDDYNPNTGVVEFRESRGHLKSDIAAPTPQELRGQGVNFFLQRNPGFRRGHELVCVCEVEEHNMRSLTLDLFRKGASG